VASFAHHATRYGGTPQSKRTTASASTAGWTVRRWAARIDACYARSGTSIVAAAENATIPFSRPGSRSRKRQSDSGIQHVFVAGSRRV